MSTVLTLKPDQWTRAGEQAADALAAYYAVAILADDPATGARVARGVAHVLAARRPVILADLAGDTPGLRELSPEPDPEGVSDSFDYGISLNRLTRVTPIHNISLVPSGGQTVERSEVFRSGRWQGFARRCRTSGSLLLVLARPTAPNVGDMVRQLDGAALVGEGSSDDVQFPVIARVLPVPEAPRTSRLRALRWIALLATAALAVLVIAVAFGMWRAGARGDVSRLPEYGVVPEADRNAGEAGAAAPAVPIPANPEDSLSALEFAIELMSANTRDGANFELQRYRAWPAATLAPVEIGDARGIWYKVVIGAYGEPRQADSLLRFLREGGLVGESAGLLVRAPLALLIDSAATRVMGRLVAAEHVGRGVPAYVLFQADGRALVYAGAFARAEDSELLAGELREAGLRPVLVYRTGRAL